MARFVGFKPEGMRKIASRMGYQGSMDDFDSYLEQNPEKKRQMIAYESVARQMASGGYIRRMQEGGTPSKFERFPTETLDYIQNKPDDYTEYEIGQVKNILKQRQDAKNIKDAPVKIPKLPDNPNPPVVRQPITTPTLPDDPIVRIPTPPDLRDIVDNLPPVDPPTGPRQLPQADVPVGTDYTPETGIGDVFTDRAQDPALPVGGVTIPVGTAIEEGQFIGDQTGQLEGTVAVDTAQATTTITNPEEKTAANIAQAAQSAAGVDSALGAVNAAQTDENDSRAKVLAAQQTESSVGDLEAAQGKATLLENPLQREIQDGELITGAADAEKAAKFTEQIDAAQATPSEKATVQGQLASLTSDFDATNPPAWAAGAIRGVQAAMQKRGIGASSIAGQALIQAAMESALPIAQADANTQAQFESQNLSNRQQRAMLAAQQRATFIGQEFDQDFQARVQNASKIADIANLNFNAEQQIALENSRVANTMNLQNLSNRQALVMAEASALANLDTANLNNRQQAAVQNAQNFLQLDMANLSNQQQTELFKAQQRIQSLFTDQAATNAANQFNAKSKNQVDQFFANLAQQTAQFNATQTNAQSQFNAGQVNTVERFNAEINNQRDQFNAQNQLAIAQNNAVWRREIATADTVAINRANELNANAILDISKEAYDNLWSHYNDTMEWAWTSADNALERINRLAIAEVGADIRKEVAAMESASAAGSAVGNLIGTLGGAAITRGLFG